MTEEPKTNHWWQTVPGVLTALATVLTAVTGMVVALGQVGIFKPSTPPPAASSSPASPVPKEASITAPSSAPAAVEPSPEAEQGKPEKHKKKK